MFVQQKRDIYSLEKRLLSKMISEKDRVKIKKNKIIINIIETASSVDDDQNGQLIDVLNDNLCRASREQWQGTAGHTDVSVHDQQVQSHTPKTH